MTHFIEIKTFSDFILVLYHVVMSIPSEYDEEERMRLKVFNNVLYMYI